METQFQGENGMMISVLITKNGKYVSSMEPLHNVYIFHHVIHNKHILFWQLKNERKWNYTRFPTVKDKLVSVILNRW
jgi:hypothetical protein